MSTEIQILLGELLNEMRLLRRELQRQRRDLQITRRQQHTDRQVAEAEAIFDELRNFLR